MTARRDGPRNAFHFFEAASRLRMQKPHVASRLFGEAIGEFEALGGRDVGGGGFPVAALAALIRTKLAQPQPGKADGVEFATVIRT
jgi:hypothetical protein